MPGTRLRRLVHAMAAAVLLVASQATPARAQFRLGPHGTYQTAILNGSFGVGGRAEIDLNFIRDGLTIAGVYDHFFLDCDNCSSYDAGGALLFGPGPFRFGAMAAYRSFDPGDPLTEPDEDAVGPDQDPQEPTDEWAFSVLVGLQFPQVPVVTPFVEFRQELGGEINRQTISAGVTVGMGARRQAPDRPGPLGAPRAASPSARR